MRIPTPLVSVDAQAEGLSEPVTHRLVKSSSEDITQNTALCFVNSFPKTSSSWLSVLGDKMFYFSANFLIPCLNKRPKNVTDEGKNSDSNDLIALTRRIVGRERDEGDLFSASSQRCNNYNVWVIGFI